MGNEKYLNYYVETLTNTLTEAFLRNVSLQTNAKINDDVIGDLTKKLEELNNICSEQRETIESLKSSNIDKTNQQQNQINDLTNELNNIRLLKTENESLRSQSTNVELFRKELMKERELHGQTKQSYELQIAELKEKIKILETPPKKKKNNNPVEIKIPKTQQETVSDESVKDGGSF